MVDVSEHQQATTRAGVGLRAVARRGAGEWLRDYGVLALSMFLLATSKWGSYLPLGIPPYVSDIVLALVISRHFLWRAGTSSPKGDGTLLRPAAVVMFVWCLSEFLRGTYSLTAVRDYAPYFYVVALFLVTVPPERVRPRVGRWIEGIIIFHASWISLSIAVPTIYSHVPNLAGKIYLFQPRNDFDGAVCGMFAAFALHRAFAGRFIPYNVALAGWNTILMLYLRERAGLLSFCFALLIVLWLRKDRAKSSQFARAKALVPVLILCLPLLYVFGSHTPTYQRFVAAVHHYVPFVHSDPAYASDTGTEVARERAWGRIIDWQDKSVSRETLGVGFGADFMHESGADILLLGGPSPDVRSPHNYFVGTWARLGVIGLGIVSVIVLCGLWLAVLVRRTAQVFTDADVLALLVTVAIPAAAAVGVILESPFGAVPYFWALGHLSWRAAELRRSKALLPLSSGLLETGPPPDTA